jgi:hypothetical protein
VERYHGKAEAVQGMYAYAAARTVCSHGLSPDKRVEALFI